MSSPPTTLGKYQIIREIARSNDIVYEAYDPLMNRRVALKELAVPGGSTSQQKDERLKRFLREAKAAGSLAHPNIVTIYEVGEDQGRNYLVMEYLDGHTLRNELDTHGFLPLDKALEVSEAILSGLEYAHQNGVIHRDIKPENIQILSDGRIKLTDFGIARLTFEPNLTMDGQVFGTPSYMSPEQVVGKDIDARSDLFSVGIVMYEMIGGSKPFSGDSVVAITYSIMNTEPPQPQQMNHSLWMVVSKALDKSSGLRYSSATEMFNAVASAKQASSNVVLDPQPPAVYNQPYPQQQAAPPIANPYMPQNPYGQNPFINTPAPPIQYPYNPYNPYQPPPGVPQPLMPPQQTIYGQGGLPPHLQGQNLPNIPIHAYYPPPPRKPLFKAETRALFHTILVVVLSVGTVLLLVLVVLMYFGGQLGPPPRNIRNPAAMGEPNTRVQPVANVERILPPLDSNALYIEANRTKNEAASASSSGRSDAESLWAKAGDQFRELAIDYAGSSNAAMLRKLGSDSYWEAFRLAKNVRNARAYLYPGEDLADDQQRKKQFANELKKLGA